MKLWRALKTTASVVIEFMVYCAFELLAICLFFASISCFLNGWFIASGIFLTLLVVALVFRDRVNPARRLDPTEHKDDD